VTIKNAVFWDVAPCKSCVNRRFGGTYRLHFQGRKIRELQIVATSSGWFLARGFFYPEDGGDTFLQDVGSHKFYKASHPRRRHSSTILFSNFLKWGETESTIVPAPDDDDDDDDDGDECEAPGGMRIGIVDQSTRGKLFQCHSLHHKSHMTWDRTQAAAVGSRRLTGLSYGTAN
jgi:hypothetical protein